MIHYFKCFIVCVYLFLPMATSVSHAMIVLDESVVSETKKPEQRLQNDRDPTAPSRQILERFQGKPRVVPPTTSVEQHVPSAVAPALPDFRLKALVMNDDGHGSALISANDRVFAIKLSRSKRLTTIGPSTVDANGLSVNGVHFAVQEFSDNSVTLRSNTDNALIIVQ